MIGYRDKWRSSLTFWSTKKQEEKNQIKKSLKRKAYEDLGVEQEKMKDQMKEQKKVEKEPEIQDLKKKFMTGSLKKIKLF